MIAETHEPEVTPPIGRLAAALMLFGIAIACPIVGTAIIASAAPNGWKVAAGALYFPIPEVFDLTAIAILGKPGFVWLKAKLFGWFRKQAPPDEVSPARYRFGLVLFVLPLVFAWLQPYVIASRTGINVVGDLMFLASFFVLGGDFWDKVRALFIHGATARFPQIKE